MRIVVNGLAARSGGARTYLENVLPRLAARPGVELAVLSYPAHAGPFLTHGLRVVSPGHAESNIPARAAWERFALPRLLRREGTGVYYAPGGLLGGRPEAGACRTAVAFRNMLPFDSRWTSEFDGYNRVRYALLRRSQVRSFSEADLLVCISEHARRVIDAAVPGRRGLSVVIPHGVDEVFRLPAEGRCPFPPGSYVLYVSPLKPYKAHLEVVESWRLFRAQNGPSGLRLVLAGAAEGAYADKVRRRIRELGLWNEVLVIGHVDHAGLPALYQGARACVFASRCENCPNILLEAMSSGRAVFSSSEPPMPEFGGDGVRLFDPARPADLAGLLGRHLHDRAFLDGLGAAGRARSLRYDWQDTADSLAVAFESMLLSAKAEEARSA